MPGKRRREALVYKGRDAPALPEDKRSARGMQIVDVSGNALELLNLDDLEQVTQLKVDKNKLSAKALGLTLEKAPALVVLSAAANAMKKLPDITPCQHLGALLLQGNFIKKVPQIPAITTLNTIVLSHNRIKDIDDGAFALLPCLKKLSLSHNSLKRVPDLSSNPGLVELRLNGNRIARVPDTLARNAELRLLDLGNNKLDEWRHTGPIHELELHNVTLKGNPLCGVPAPPKDDEEESGEQRDERERAVEAYKAQAQRILVHLRVLDGRVVGATAERLQQRKRRIADKRKKGIPLGTSYSEAHKRGDGGEASGGEAVPPPSPPAAAAKELGGDAEAEAAGSRDERERKRGQRPEKGAAPAPAAAPFIDEEQERAALMLRLKEEGAKRRVSGVVAVEAAGEEQPSKRARTGKGTGKGKGKSKSKSKKGARGEADEAAEGGDAAPAAAAAAKKEPFDPSLLARADPTAAIGGGLGGGW